MNPAIIATFVLAAATLSTMAHGQDAETYPPTVPLMLPASDSFLQSFVRLINKSDQAGEVSITAVDDGGTVYDTVTVQLAALQTFHFNSGDLTNGNANKGIDDGIGAPRQGNLRLTIETNLDVEALSYTRARDGFLTATHELLPESDDGYLVKFFNPASNTTQQSRLRLINWSSLNEPVRIEGVDDSGNSAGPVSLTLPAGQSRMLTAIDLEEGAEGLNGMLGDGMGKWQLNIRAHVDSIAVQSLLYSSSGHISNLSAAGSMAVEPSVVEVSDEYGNTLQTATSFSMNSSISGAIDYASDEDWFRLYATESGIFTAYTSWATLDTVGRLYDSEGNQLASNDDGEGSNFRIERHVDDGAYFVSVQGFGSATGSYTFVAEFDPDNNHRPDDHGDTRQAATALRANSSLSGAIDYASDEDWFRLVLPPHPDYSDLHELGRILLYTTGSTNTTGAMYVDDNRIVSLYDDDRGEDGNFHLRFWNSTYGGRSRKVIFYLKIAGFNSQIGPVATGPYTVHFDFAPTDD